MFERELIPIVLACNDERGHFASKLWALYIGDNMRFECRFVDWTPRLRYVRLGSNGKAALSIAGRHFPIKNHTEWVGNWCCDEVRMEGRHVLELLNWPRFRKWYDITEGESRLFNWWESGNTWTDSDLRLIGKVFR